MEKTDFKNLAEFRLLAKQIELTAICIDEILIYVTTIYKHNLMTKGSFKKF